MSAKKSNDGRENGLMNLFGLVSKKEVKGIMGDLKKIKKTDIKLMKRAFLELKI